ncbi:hypothetical protein GSI_01017 [Ganoderma sinense ZZ0214-1]|uniref:DUF6534 domain-containing protein n=1 Tax=Ganoderma sinense ZZ0214-1 TaxID=1077348 RepID=A0A2G8SU95_9APHY|nr:hypothetical protein GSI_01017 [Ganoderma sinense ZZ0214-1]
MAPYVSTGVVYSSSTADASGRPDPAIAGPVLIQAFMQYLFQGVIITQTVKFYERCRDDPMTLRLYVFLLLLLSILQTMIMSYKAWVATIEVMQWATSENIWILFSLAILCLVSLVAAIILTVKIGTTIVPNLQESHPDPLHASAFAYPLWVYSSLCTAIALTIILSHSLWKTKTGLTHLDHTVETIIFLTWETALLPSICMLTSAIIFSIRDAQGSGTSVAARSHLDLFFALLTGKLYALGILRTLNSRTLLRERLQSIPLGRQSLSRWEWAEPRENFRTSQEGADASEEGDTVGGGSDESRKGPQPTPTTTTVDVTEFDTLPAVAAPIVVMQPSPEGVDPIVGNGSGIDPFSLPPLRQSIPIQRRMSAARDPPSPEPHRSV